MNHVFDQGPELRAVVPLHARQEAQETMGVPLRGGFYNLLPGAIEQRKPAIRARSMVRKVLPDEVRAMFTELCAPPSITLFYYGQNNGIRPSNLGLRAGESASFFVNEEVCRLCAENFADLVAGGKRPFIDWEHNGETQKVGFVRDVYEIPLRGVFAVVDWSDFAEELIKSGEAKHFSPCFSISDDEQRYFLGISENIGGLLHRSSQPGFPAQRASIKPVSRLEEVVFRASHFRRRAQGRADAEEKLKQQMPAGYTAFRRYQLLEREYGPSFYLTHA